MSDLTRIDAALAIELTDGISQSAALGTAIPAGTEIGLIVRDAIKGQQTMADSRPVVFASDQSTLPVSFSTSSVFLIKSGDSSSVDAFTRWRTSDPFTIFESSLNETDQTLFWDSSLTGSATSTWLQNQAAIRLRCTTASGDQAIRQTKQYLTYQPGKSLMVIIAAVMGSLKANVRQRIGYFDANNGLFWEQDGTNLKVVRRTFVSGSAVDNTVNQSAWNVDKLDGTGVSGITLDTSKIQLFLIDFGWLGSGRIRMGFVIAGQIYYCHQFLIGNTLSDVSMSRATLPIRFEITNTAAAASTTDLLLEATTVISEGGYNPAGFVRSISNGTTTKTVSSTLIPLLSLRLKSANIRASILPTSTALWVTDNADIQWQVLLNTTLTGASFASVGANSIAESDTSATALSGGELIASGYTGNAQTFFQNFNSRLRLGATIGGTSDILTIAAVRIATTDATVLSQLEFQEIY